MMLRPGQFGCPSVSRSNVVPLIPLNTRLIFVGDSITNVSNAAASSHRAYRHWFNFYTKGHFYCTPASNQGMGAATLTSQADATRYIRLRDDFWLSQVSPGTAVFFAIGTNDGTVPSLQQMKDELQTNIDNVLALGGIVIVAAIAPSANNQTAGANLTRWQQWNAHVASLHDPAGGVYALTSRATATVPATDTYDNLHFNGGGARKTGFADAMDILPYLDTSQSLLYGTVAANDNLDPNWDLDGTGGVAGTGTTGQVATGWSAYCSSNGTSGGSTIGLTASCSKTTINIPGVGTVPAQQIDITGTASNAGIATLANTITGLALQFGDYLEAWAYVKITHTDGVSAPVGMNTIYAGAGTAGGIFSKTVDANAGDISAAIEGVLRTVPTMKLQNSNSELFEVSCGIKAGTVNIRIVIAQMGARLTETVAYAAPFNLGADMSGLGGFTNPIGPRPRLNGTASVGSNITLQPATINGGGPTFEQCRLKRDGVTILTKNPGDTPMTYTVQAEDAGTTLTLEHELTNSFGNVVAVSAGVAIT